MIKTIPLDKLVASPRNVRRSTDEQADLQLKADIEARGLLQNLVVTPARKPRGSFAVEAGGRRLRALQRLSEEGKLSRSHEVSCLILENVEGAREASLAENFQRLGMNPADECIAFQQLIEQGAGVEDIARRFGLTIRFVEGRLRLSALAPAVFEALGAGEISLDVAKAYAATPDRERQAFVFEQIGRGYGGAHPDTIRRMMTQATVSANDRRALLVGEEAYVAAGGQVERDLFSEDAGARWLDIALLERLATEKMEAVAAETAAELGYGFITPTLDSWIGYGLTEGLRRVVVEAAPLSDEETAEVAALDAEIEDLVVLLQDPETSQEERVDAQGKIREISARIEAIVNKPSVIDEALKPSVGAFLVLDDNGCPRLDPRLYTAADPEREEPASGDGGGTPGGARGTAGKPPSVPQRLLDELAIQRRDILAVHVAADPGFALDLATFLMVDRDHGYAGGKRGSSLIAMPPCDPVPDFATPDAKATIARAQAAEALDRSWMQGEIREDRFDAFRALAEESRAGWLVHAVAGTLEASLLHSGPRACGFHDHLGQLLGIDVARWWRPTGANYFDRVPKAMALAALEQIGGPSLAGRYSKAKKAELAQACERIMAGDFIADVEVKEAALAWVPDPMRFALPAASPEPAGGPAEAPSGDIEAEGPPDEWIAAEVKLGHARAAELGRAA